MKRVVKVKVLLVDDHQVVRAGIRQILSETSDITVTDEAASGEELLTNLKTVSYDVIVLDISLPGMNGLEVLGRLKQDQPDLPVVMMSGNATIENAVQATKMGACDFVEKPLSTEKILITLDNALNLAHRANLSAGEHFRDRLRSRAEALPGE